MPSDVRKSTPVEAWLSQQQAKLYSAGYSKLAALSLGALVLEGLREAPDFLLQIDGATGEEETCGSVLARSVRCARAMTAAGLRTGDVVALMDVNHNDICVPLYAAYFLGITVANISYTLKRDEITGMFGVMRPKLVFCQSDIIDNVQLAIEELNLGARVVSFGTQFTKFNELGNDDDLESFRAVEIDPEETIAVLLPSSGTTGDPKINPITHKNLLSNVLIQWRSYKTFPTPERLQLVTSLLPWAVGTIHFTMSPILRYTRLSSSDVSPDAVTEIIGKYRPSCALIAPTRMRALLRRHARGELDLSCLERVTMVGYAAPPQFFEEIKRATPNTKTASGYGITEISGCAFDFYDVKPGSVGHTSEIAQYRLVDPWKNEEIVQPGVTGELWIKGPMVIKGYYKNPKQSKEAFTEDGWFRSGDILYRDEDDYYYFVDRIKNYFSNEVPAAALETVIAAHPGVEDVAVVAAAGDEPTACVVRAPGSEVTAEEIEGLVKASFIKESMHLSGGVVFVAALPASGNGKLDRKKLSEFVLGLGLGSGV